MSAREAPAPFLLITAAQQRRKAPKTTTECNKKAALRRIFLSCPPICVKKSVGIKNTPTF